MELENRERKAGEDASQVGRRFVRRFRFSKECHEYSDLEQSSTNLGLGSSFLGALLSGAADSVGADEAEEEDATAAELAPPPRPRPARSPCATPNAANASDHQIIRIQSSNEANSKNTNTASVARQSQTANPTQNQSRESMGARLCSADAESDAGFDAAAATLQNHHRRQMTWRKPQTQDNE